MKIVITILLLVLFNFCKAADFHKQPSSPNVTLTAIIADTDSSILIVGYEGTSLTRGILIRADINGDTIWSKSFEENLSVQFHSLALSFDSTRIVVVGNLEVASGPKNGLIIEFDREGNIQWQKKYNYYLTDDLFEEISFINNKTFAVSTRVYPNAGSLILFDSSGYSFKAIIGGYLDSYSAPILLANGNIFISAVSYGGPGNSSTNFGFKVDTSLTNVYWSNVYNTFTNNNSGDAGKKGIALSDGGCIFSNMCQTVFSMNYATYRLDSSGHVLWSIIGGPYFTEFANGDYLFSNNNYYNPTPVFIRMDYGVSTFANYNSLFGCNGLTSIDGKIICISQNSFYGFDSLDCSMTNIGSASDSGMNYPVDPHFGGSGSAFNYNTTNLNLTPADGISFYQDCTPVEISKYETSKLKIYPNPSEGKIKIKFDELFRDHCTIRVYDLMGRNCFFESINTIEEAGIHEFDFTSFPKGIYFVEIYGSNSNSISKLILE